MIDDSELPRLPRPYTTLGRFVDRDQQTDVFTRDQLLAYGRACAEAERERAVRICARREASSNNRSAQACYRLVAAGIRGSSDE